MLEILFIILHCWNAAHLFKLLWLFITWGFFIFSIAILDQLGSKEKPSLPVGCPALLAAALANIAENVMGGSSGAVSILYIVMICIHVCLKLFCCGIMSSWTQHLLKFPLTCKELTFTDCVLFSFWSNRTVYYTIKSFFFDIFRSMTFYLIINLVFEMFNSLEYHLNSDWWYLSLCLIIDV